MNELQLGSLSIKNFKGTKKRKVEFGPVTTIYGENGTGKTTIGDAVKFLFFNKDSDNRTDFSIKPLDENNEPIHNLVTELESNIIYNGDNKLLKKTYEEVWSTKRGTGEERMTGHTSKYWIDKVKKNSGEFNKALAEIIDEDIFRMLSDPYYFSDVIPWEKRREIVIALVDAVEERDIVAKDQKLSDVIEWLKTKSMKDVRTTFAEDRKKLKEDLVGIHYRIDEATDAIKKVDFETFKAELAVKEAELKTTEDQLLTYPKPDETKIAEIAKTQSKITQIETKADNDKSKKEREVRNAINSLENDLSILEKKVTDFDSNKESTEAKIAKLDEKLEGFRTDWHKINSRVFEINEDFLCPTCNQKLPEDEIEAKKIELQKNFNQSKADDLRENEENGHKTKSEKESLEKYLESRDQLVKNVDDKKAEIEAKKTELAEIIPIYPEDYESLKDSLVRLQKEVEQPADITENVAQAKVKKDEVQKKIDELKEQLHQEKVNKERQERIKELEKEQKEIGQKIADIQLKEDLCGLYILTEAELLEDRINEKFSLAKFKMFKKQINGGIEPICEVLINGVPFKDANHAGQINVGIDIINTISEHSQIRVPIFIDSAESVTNFIDTESQVIRLNVARLKLMEVFDAEEEAAKYYWIMGNHIVSKIFSDKTEAEKNKPTLDDGLMVITEEKVVSKVA